MGPRSEPAPAQSDPHEVYFAELAAYVMGALGAQEMSEFERHLSGCQDCQQELPQLRMATGALEEMPPEALLDGPPEGAELLIARTVRRIETSGPVPVPARGGGARRLLVAAAAVVLLVAAGGVIGGAIGRGTAPEPVAGATPTVTTTSTVTVSPGPTDVPGTRTLTASDPGTGAALNARLIPAKGWVRLTVSATGIKAGQKCRLVVVDKADRTVEAGSWLVSAIGEKDGTTLQGSALVAPADVKAVQVVTFDGDVLVTAEA